MFGARRRVLGILCGTVAGLLVVPVTAHANATGGFDTFCSEWMGKLAERERSNQDQAPAKHDPDGVVVEYTGYVREPVSCTARLDAKGKPLVGILVYHEVRYRRSGADRAQARTNAPTEVERVEVTEVFRYDGARWAY